MSDCDHFPIRLIRSVYYPKDEKFDSRVYTFCNDCGEKVENPKDYFLAKKIPELDAGRITKVICSIKTNGKEYRWFGHAEDWNNYEENGDRWE